MYGSNYKYSQIQEDALMKMHKSSPEFVEKLYSMLEDTRNENYLRWNADGRTFLIINPSEFAKNVLENHFKHGNLSSFVRQLNKYDFHKIKSLDIVVDTYGTQTWEFKNDFFQRDRKDLMMKIRRKRSNSEKNLRNSDDSLSNGSEMNTVFEKQVLNSLKIISGYFQVIVDTTNAISELFMEQQSKIMKKEKIFLCEDSIKTQEFAFRMLNKMGYWVATAESEDEAMVRIENERFDIYFISYLLTNSNALVKKIRKINQDAQIVLLTDKEHKQMSITYFNLGVNEILVKPYPKETICYIVDKCVNQIIRNIPWTPICDE